MNRFCFPAEVFFTRQQSNEVAAWCGPLLQDGDSRKSGMQIFHRRDWDKDAGNRIGTEAVEKAAELLSAAPIKGGKLPVVLDEHVAPRFLGMFFGAFSAESAQRGMSRLAGKTGPNNCRSGTDFAR